MKQYKDTPYFVTEEGKVFRNGKELKTQIGKKNGYEYKVMKLNDVRTTVYIHRMVAEVYVKNINNNPEVNHWDGNKLNNNYSNLIWSTRKDNLLHSTRVLKKKTREDHNMCKLNENDVLYIRNKYVKGDKIYGMNALSKKFDVSPATIHKIIHNKTWFN